MAKYRNKKERQEYLTSRTLRFYNRYGDELHAISQLLKIKLDQLALAYTLENNLPREAIEVRARVKSTKSFLRKLSEKNWPNFYYPTEVIKDLVGARIICWFLDDCYGMLNCIASSKQIHLRPRSLEDYVKHPKSTGYRSVHVLVDVPYDRVGRRGKRRMVSEGTMICEIQLRTKLQDAWGEFTHEVHYKVPDAFEQDYETIVAEIANRLAAEDRNALAVRNLLQREESKRHEGFIDVERPARRAKRHS